MPIVIKLDELMREQKVSLNELSRRVNITLSNLSILKNGKARAIRVETMQAICVALNCEPGDWIKTEPDE